MQTKAGMMGDFANQESAKQTGGARRNVLGVGERIGNKGAKFVTLLKKQFSTGKGGLLTGI